MVRSGLSFRGPFLLVDVERSGLFSGARRIRWQVLAANEKAGVSQKQLVHVLKHQTVSVTTLLQVLCLFISYGAVAKPQDFLAAGIVDHWTVCSLLPYGAAPVLSSVCSKHFLVVCFKHMLL